MDTMLLILKGLPEIAFAHRYVTDHYNLSLPASRNLFEISYIASGTITQIYENGARLEIPACSVSLFPHQTACQGIGNEEGHEHYTVGVQGEFELTELTPETYAQTVQNLLTKQNRYPYMVLLPKLITDKKKAVEIERLLKTMIQHYALPSQPNRLACISCLFQLFSFLTEISINRVHSGQSAAFSEIRYCEQAMEYLNCHLEKAVSLQEIADQLQISAGHLCRIFKAVTGQTLIEYRNRRKIELAQELILSHHATLDEIGNLIGIPDEKYLCRLFKKYTGMTVGAFKKSNADSLAPESKKAETEI